MISTRYAHASPLHTGNPPRMHLTDIPFGTTDWTSVEVWLQMSRWALGEPFAWRCLLYTSDAADE